MMAAKSCMPSHLPFIDALDSGSGHPVPVAAVLPALGEEVRDLVARLVAVGWIDMEARDPVDDDLRRTSLVGREGEQAAVHCLYHCQTKCFVQSRLEAWKKFMYSVHGHGRDESIEEERKNLHKSSFGVGDAAVQLTVPHAIVLCCYPTQLAF